MQRRGKTVTIVAYEVVCADTSGTWGQCEIDTSGTDGANPGAGAQASIGRAGTADNLNGGTGAAGACVCEFVCGQVLLH